jgi:uncharacterized protein YbcV (DUF1398 family)
MGTTTLHFGNQSLFKYTKKNMNFKKLLILLLNLNIYIYIFYLSQQIQNFFHRNYCFC